MLGQAEPVTGSSVISLPRGCLAPSENLPPSSRSPGAMSRSLREAHVCHPTFTFTCTRFLELRSNSFSFHLNFEIDHHYFYAPGLKLSPFKMGIIKVNESLKSVDISYNLWNKTKGCLHHFTIYTSVMAFCMYLFCAMEILYTYLVLGVCLRQSYYIS